MSNREIKELIQKELKRYKIILIFCWILIGTGIALTIYSLGAYLYFIRTIKGYEALIRFLFSLKGWENDLWIIIWHYYFIPGIIGIVTILCGVMLLHYLKINHKFALYIKKNLKCTQN